MRTSILSVLFILSLLLLTSCTDNRVKTRFFTQGACADCQNFIEDILSSQKGVDSVRWNYQTSMAEVVFDTTRTSESELQQALAKGGFSTAFYEADSANFGNLPECCRSSSSRKLIPKGIHGH